MGILSRLRGACKDKNYLEKDQEIRESIHAKKNEYTSEMLKVHHQMRTTRKQGMQVKAESVKLKQFVDDVTHRVAVATGGIL